MIIAVNTRTLTGNTASMHFWEACFQKIVVLNPDHHFIFIAAKALDLTIAVNKNVQILIIEQQSANPLLWKLWYQYKLPAFLKKIKADVLVNTDGICSLRTPIPQCLIVNELNFLLHPEWNTKKFNRFMQSNTTAFLQKAKKIIVHSAFVQQQITGKYGIDHSTTTVIYPGKNSSFQPISWDEKVQTKEKYSKGKEYFLFNGELNTQSNLITLLKAFSFFKKRQKSNMQLIIIAKHVSKNNPVIASLATYKYRNELVVLENLDNQEIHKITAAAYAFVSMASYEDDYSKLFDVLQCKVPLVVSNHDENIEMLAAAALYANSESFEDIAEKMMLLFKDENQRQRIIDKAVLQADNYIWDSAASLLWKNILITIE